MPNTSFHLHHTQPAKTIRPSYQQHSAALPAVAAAAFCVSSCFGNLEQVHNDIHNILGGTSGEMATILYAGFDPLFWLHHCQLDRALWLFQNNNGQWQGDSECHVLLAFRRSQ
jgi:hypothetical protein